MGFKGLGLLWLTTLQTTLSTPKKYTKPSSSAPGVLKVGHLDDADEGDNLEPSCNKPG